MTTYKTLSGVIKASESLAAEIRSNPARDQREYESYSKRVDSLLRQLNALWSNPTDVSDAAKAKADLVDAWNGA